VACCVYVQTTGQAYTYATLCFFGGIVLSALLSRLVHMLDPDHSHDLEGPGGDDRSTTLHDGAYPVPGALSIGG
jgi:hypothetical protein